MFRIEEGVSLDIRMGNTPRKSSHTQKEQLNLFRMFIVAVRKEWSQKTQGGARMSTYECLIVKT